MALKGNIGFLSRDRVRGWAFDPERPTLPVSLIVLADGEVVARALADRLRPDLIKHTNTSGRHGFDVVLRAPLARGVRHLIEVRREEDGASLPNSPRALEPAAAFDADARAEWRGILAAADTDDDYEQRLTFLLEETAKLRAAYARRTGGLEDRERLRRSRWTGEGSSDPSPPPRARSSSTMRRPIPSATRARTRSCRISSRCNAWATTSASPPPAFRANPRRSKRWASTSIKSRRPTPSRACYSNKRAYAAIYLHRVAIASKYLELARAHQPRARIVYSVADLHHVRLARQANVERRPELMALAQNTLRLEIAAAQAADAVVTHSPVEARWLARHVRPEKVFVVPWAVEPRPVTTPFAERSGVAFIAGFGHAPNVDAAYGVVETIMPEIWRTHPHLRLSLVGSQTPPSIQALASERVEIVGFAPDLAQVFERMRLSVAPLAFGAGVKGKVLESLAAGVPCVCTPVAAEGFDFAPPLSQLVADTPEALARLIVAMHEEPERNATAAQAGLQFVAAFASEARVTQGLRGAFAVDAAPL